MKEQRRKKKSSLLSEIHTSKVSLCDVCICKHIFSLKTIAPFLVNNKREIKKTKTTNSYNFYEIVCSYLEMKILC